MKKRIGFALISIGAVVGAHLFAAKLPEVWDSGRGVHIGDFHESQMYDAYQLLGLGRASTQRLPRLLGKAEQVTVNDVAWP